MGGHGRDSGRGAGQRAIGFIREGRAENAIATIRAMLAPMATVIRKESRRRLPAEEFLVDDIVVLEGGDRVRADLRLVEARNLVIDGAVLTGESVPVSKGVDPVPRDAPLGDRRSMAFMGTTVARGAGRGVVVATGSRTEIGRISGLLEGVERLNTPLIEQMDRFSRWLALLILLASAFLFVFGYFVGLIFSAVVSALFLCPQGRGYSIARAQTMT